MMSLYFALLFCLLGLAAAQNCDQQIQQFFACYENAHANKPDHEAMKAQMDSCFAGCPGGNPSDRFGGRFGSRFGGANGSGSGLDFECMRNIKRSMKQSCEQSLNLPFKLPEHKGHGPHGHGGHGFGGPRRFGGSEGLEQIGGEGPVILANQAQRGPSFGSRRFRRHGGHGHGLRDRGDHFSSMISELCPDNADSVQACIDSVTAPVKLAHETMRACKYEFEATGCQAELDSIKERMCTCMTESARSDPSILSNCVSQGSEMAQRLQSDEEFRVRIAGGHHCGRRGESGEGGRFAGRGQGSQRSSFPARHQGTQGGAQNWSD